ncbi:MAG: hypothetical protein QMD61_00615 [Methanobacterium sp.]|nr:hypothetical protein [Methanobacterium sp.]
MKGFDRPLKPEWIYNVIQEIEIGDKISDHKEDLHNLIWELEGKDGKRKVITVLSRYYLKTHDNSKGKVVEDVPIIHIAKKYPLESIEPLLLYQLLFRSPMLRTLTKMIKDIYGHDNPINYTFLRKKVIEKFGEKDISARSIRNLISTLVSFGLLEKKGKEYIWTRKTTLDELNFCLFLKLYSEEFKKSPQINLDDLEDYLFLYYDLPDVNTIAKKYNSVLWEYSIRLGQKVVTFHDQFFWDSETLIKVFKKI